MIRRLEILFQLSITTVVSWPVGTLAAAGPAAFLPAGRPLIIDVILIGATVGLCLCVGQWYVVGITACSCWRSGSWRSRPSGPWARTCRRHNGTWACHRRSR